MFEEPPAICVMLNSIHSDKRANARVDVMTDALTQDGVWFSANRWEDTILIFQRSLSLRFPEKILDTGTNSNFLDYVLQVARAYSSLRGLLSSPPRGQCTISAVAVQVQLVAVSLDHVGIRARETSRQWLGSPPKHTSNYILVVEM